LQLDDIKQYRNLLSGSTAEAEWARLDKLCHISISRFYRDKGIFQCLEHQLLPRLQEQVVACNRGRLHIWSIGCASGEEPYTLALMSKLTQALSQCQVDIVATDTDPNLLARANQACYPASSLRELPSTWRIAFERRKDEFCLQMKYREAVSFAKQDIREQSIDGSFDLILCRNLVFTYFEPTLQSKIARRLADALVPGGFLLLGAHESLPEPLPWLKAEHAWLYRRNADDLPGG
jgi:chemotaxis protein methyltransferase CheR